VAILTRDALLAASDLREKTVALPSLGQGSEVRIRSLPAEYSNAALSQAIEVVQGPKGEQTTRMDNGKLELLQVLHGLVEPRLESLAAVQTFAKNCGPAFKTLVREIVELSDLTAEAAEMTAERFQAGGAGAPEASDHAASNGSGGSDLPARVGT
jgi:hypothetical protein